MTLYGATDPQVLGQPISPFFGAQQNVRYAGAPTIPQPPVVPGSGPQKTLLEAVARGEMPRNANIASVAGVASSVGITNANGDPMSVDEGMSSGNGAQVSLGAPIPGNAGNPGTITTAGINTQEFVDGIATQQGAQVTGPAATNIESLTSAPLSGATVVGNVSLVASSFQG